MSEMIDANVDFETILSRPELVHGNHDSGVTDETIETSKLLVKLVDKLSDGVQAG